MKKLVCITLIYLQLGFLSCTPQDLGESSKISESCCGDGGNMPPPPPKG